MQFIVESDSRRRLSLARLGVEKDAVYLAERRDDGSIVLTPADVRPKVLEVVERVFPDLDELAAIDTGEPDPLWDAAKAEVDATD